MRRGWALLLCVYLLGWVPVSFAAELFATMGSLGRRGAPATIELSLHAVSAVVCATAGRMVLIRAPAASGTAALGVVLSSVMALQSLFWTALPRNVAPGATVPTAAVVCAHAVFWLVMLALGRRAERR